jgi:hypothetical protein
VWQQAHPLSVTDTAGSCAYCKHHHAVRPCYAALLSLPAHLASQFTPLHAHAMAGPNRIVYVFISVLWQV